MLTRARQVFQAHIYAVKPSRQKTSDTEQHIFESATIRNLQGRWCSKITELEIAGAHTTSRPK